MKNTDLRRWIYLAVLIILLVVTGYFKGGLKIPGNNGDSDLDVMRDKAIVYTRHAECRMDCRTISEKEIEAVLAAGRVNWKKTDLQDKPCPTYALEDRTADGQLVRIVFANCANTVKVVTAIDLQNEYSCNCR